MANKDYVRRGRSPKKPTPKKTAPRRKPWRSGLLALLLISGFSYGLFLLSRDPEPPQAVVVPTKPVAKPKPEKVIPPPPEEKWDYVDSLPKREVEVVAKEQKVSEIPYIMQCGAYKTSSQAESRKLDIAFQGLKSEIRKTEGSSWYRVVLGPYKYKRDAQRDEHKLQRAKIEPCAIWTEPQ
ncbi:MULTISPECIES: SPOR domain-containing protein [Vibrio]|uniref:SPOR domain-containing protein n=2 Tax=Vibrio TaxID=662 RepID=A0ABD4QZ34_VIBAN|nr:MULTISPECIES: SPOR domain-containing protein [Vibrio]ASU23246.1 cell division protein FtsN [Vibrio qinghaiensis]MBT2920448.1 SPOR domain-containing protein [Vibrio anguillarum]